MNEMGEMENGPFVRPTVMYPATSTMRMWTEEQFGPLIPVAEYTSLDDVYSYLDESTFGQQAAIFTSDPTKCGPLIDALSNNVGRVNINAQCQRGPDMLPVTGRKSSALGTLSVSEALKTVSIESVIATKDNGECMTAFKGLAAASDCNILTAPDVSID